MLFSPTLHYQLESVLVSAPQQGKFWRASIRWPLPKSINVSGTLHFEDIALRGVFCARSLVASTGVPKRQLSTGLGIQRMPIHQQLREAAAKDSFSKSIHIVRIRSTGMDMTTGSGHIQVKVKCLNCGLHFVICTYWPDRHKADQICCPECRKHEGSFLVWREDRSEQIFQVVPGQAQAVNSDEE